MRVTCRRWAAWWLVIAGAVVAQGVADIQDGEVGRIAQPSVELDFALGVLQKYEAQLHEQHTLQAGQKSSVLSLQRNAWKLVPSMVRPYMRKAQRLLLWWRRSDSGTVVYKRPGLAQLPQAVQQAIGTLYAQAKAGVEDAVYAAAEMEMYGKYGMHVDVDAAYTHYSQLAALSGNATAQYMAGFLHATGLGHVDQRNSLALLHTTLAATQGHGAAEATLAFRQASGIGVAQSCDAALSHYRSVARTGIRHYLAGEPLGRHMPAYRAWLSDDRGGVYGVRTGPYSLHRTTDRAAFGELLEYHQFNARAGNAKASLTLVDLYYHGHRFAPRDFGLARKHLSDIVAALFTRQGELRRGLAPADAATAAQAAGMLGVMSWRGEGGAADTRGALRWLGIGATLGHGTALNALGSMYRDGVGVPRDMERALALFKQAADKGHQGSQVSYALAVLDTQPTEAMALLRAAAENGHVLAHYHLAGFHAGRSSGDEAECRMAVASYRFVAERADWLHSPIAQAEAAAERGDVEAAAVGYMQAAEMGYDVGQLNAALLLEQLAALNSTALLPNADAYRRQALVYWTRAANQNVADARAKQGDAYYYGLGVSQSYARAAAAYALAARTEASGLAMWSLGWMYEHGLGVAQDFHLAKRWYDQSLDANPQGRLAAHASLVRLGIRYLYAWACGRDVGEGPLFFAPRPVTQDDEERANPPPMPEHNVGDPHWEHGAADDNDEEDGGDTAAAAGGSLSESVFFILLLLAAAWMFLPLR
ncbi:ERAD-associated protein [Coemansia sp. BCRC 34301]|nr:ERAD-associated protein [Coemansia sp. BCRC 34301]